MKLSLLLTLPLCLGAPALGADHIDELIDQGRAKLDAGNVTGALEFFNQADAVAQGALRARMWVLRAHFQQATQIFDAFDQVDALAADHSGSELDYLYGMGSYFKAKKFMAEGVTDQSVGFAFMDAQDFLKDALEADPERYYDAWYPLADASWMNRDLPSAERAVGQAAKLRPKDPGVKFLLGRVAFSLYTDTKVADEAGAAARLDLALATYVQVLELIGQPKRHPLMVAAVYKQLGIAQGWKGETDASHQSYAASIGWDPNSFDYSGYWTNLGLDAFLPVLEQGAANYQANYGQDNAGDATLLWWLGSAYHSAEKFVESERTFQQVLEKWPAYTNSWWYIALARYHTQDYVGAIYAWQEHWKADATDLVRSIQADMEFNLRILDYVVGECAKKGQARGGADGTYNVYAAFLSEVRCAVDGENWEYWDNWGLFARDGGQFLFRRNSKPEDRVVAKQLYEQAWVAYQEASKLAPNKPHLLNDGAVILHYYLERDFERALEMYDQAEAMAAAQLEAGGLSEEDRALVEIALRDSRNNRDALKKKMGGGD